MNKRKITLAIFGVCEVICEMCDKCGTEWGRLWRVFIVELKNPRGFEYTHYSKEK